jgi:hypothetical protein
MAFERRLDDAPLNAAAASVHDAHVRETGRGRRVDVLGDDGRNVARREGVEIQLPSNRDMGRRKRVVSHKAGVPLGSRRLAPQPLYPPVAAGCCAVTTVLMPPRIEKSPTTVMRRGWIAATRSSRIWLVTAS